MHFTYSVFEINCMSNHRIMSEKWTVVGGRDALKKNKGINVITVVGSNDQLSSSTIIIKKPFAILAAYKNNYKYDHCLNFCLQLSTRLSIIILIIFSYH
jgi:hypothetical protein